MSNFPAIGSIKKDLEAMQRIVFYIRCMNYNRSGKRVVPRRGLRSVVPRRGLRSVVRWSSPLQEKIPVSQLITIPPEVVVPPAVNFHA